MNSLYAAIEAGGTKFNAAVFNEDGRVLEQTTIPTTEPIATFAQCLNFFNGYPAAEGFKSLGVASFGPVDILSASETYGTILNTPKPMWQGASYKQFFTAQLNCPLAIDTDVNAAALAEVESLSANSNLAYITVGTGIGVGVVINGQTIKGQMHPELGHVAAILEQGAPPGVCYAHGSCVEGVVSGAAIQQRWGSSAEVLAQDPNHPVWQECAVNLAHLCYIVALAYSPKRIVIGGGVMAVEFVLPKILEAFKQYNNGYLLSRSIGEDISQFICPPTCSIAPGLYGAYLLAKGISND